MSQLHKLYQKVKSNPHTVRFEELQKLLLGAGFKERNPGGSHYTYTKGVLRITVPYRRPYILEVYIRLVLIILEGDLFNEDD